MFKACLRVVPVLTLCLLAAAASAGAGPASRTFELVYRATIGPVEAGDGALHVFVPLALENAHQHIVSETIDASIPGKVETEAAHGNRFWHGSLPKADTKPVTVTVDYVVERRVFHPEPGAKAETPTPEELERYLRPNRLVPVGDKVLDPILAEIREKAGAGGRAATARATYDWVVDHLEYKKVGTGWGNGDTFWACSARYGNCTDFHSLFISLARTEGIPARFEMGFPVPDDRPAGDIAGYHCWVEFWVPGTGWFPIDASEAFKHPEKREMFYGTQPTDRIQLSIGRDITLGPDQHGPALNYFVYPYVEVGGKPWQGPIEKSFSYKDAATAAGAPSSR